MNDTINNTDSLIKRYSEITCRIHTMLSRLNTSSNQRGFNMYCISYIKSMLLQLQCNNAFQSTKEQPLTMLPTGVFIDSTAALMAFRWFNFPTVQLPVWQHCNLRPGRECDLRPSRKCDLRLGRRCDLRPSVWNYEGGRALEASAASAFLPLMKSFQAW